MISSANNQATEATYYYSLDSGNSWEGPFSETEIKEFRQVGIIDDQTLIQKTESTEADTATGNTAIPKDDRLPSLKSFSIKTFFSEVFKHHTKEEVVSCFLGGTREGTPPLSQVSTVFPTPWIFARMMVFCIILYVGFSWALGRFGNINLVPALIFVGNFGIPFCCFLLFYELNVRRDILFYDGMKALVGGSLISIVVTLLLHENNQFQSPIWAGPIEELAKLLAAILIAGSLRRGHTFTGLVIGAAVGSGFAAFESAGYTFAELLRPFLALLAKAQGAEVPDSAFYNAPDYVMQLRAVLSLCTHPVWTAITAGAYWMYNSEYQRKDTEAEHHSIINFSVLMDIRFIRIALIPVGLHMLWNGIAADYGFFGYFGLGFIAWLVALKLVMAGIKQIESEKNHL